MVAILAWGSRIRPTTVQEHRSALHEDINMQLSAEAVGADDGGAYETMQERGSAVVMDQSGIRMLPFPSTHMLQA